MKTTILSLLAIVLFCSCATNTGDPIKDRNARVTNATMEIVGRAVETFALNTFLNVAQQKFNGQEIDMGFAASQGIATASQSIITGADIGNVINAWGDFQLPSIAQQAAKQFNLAAPRTDADRAAVANVISTAISNAATKAIAALP